MIIEHGFYKAPATMAGYERDSLFGSDPDAGQSEGRLQTGRVWGTHNSTDYPGIGVAE